MNRDAALKAIANGHVVILPKGWLERFLSTERKETIIAKGKRAPIAGSKPGRKDRIYNVVSGKETLRKARATEQKVFDYVKAHKDVTISQVSGDLKIPPSTVAYTFRKLTRKGAVHFA